MLHVVNVMMGNLDEQARCGSQTTVLDTSAVVEILTPSMATTDRSALLQDPLTPKQAKKQHILASGHQSTFHFLYPQRCNIIPLLLVSLPVQIMFSIQCLDYQLFFHADSCTNSSGSNNPTQPAADQDKFLFSDNPNPKRDLAEIVSEYPRWLSLKLTPIQRILSVRVLFILNDCPPVSLLWRNTHPPSAVNPCILVVHCAL